MKVVKKEKSFSQKKIREYDIRRYSFTIILLAVGIFLLSYSIRNLIKDQNWANPMALLVVFSMILGALTYITCKWILKGINMFFDHADNEQGKAIAGDEGETKVLTKLKEILDDNYTAHLNYKIPNRKFDIDFLVVGPKGLVAIEVKNYSDRMLFFKDQAIKVQGSGYTRQVTKLDGDFDPRNKFKNHCKSLNHYLYSIGLSNVRVKRVIVFINDNNKIEENPGTFIVQGINRLNSYFTGLRQDDRFTSDFCEIVNQKLKNN